MPKKIQITKLDIIRWIAVLPISVIVLLLYGEISSWINYAYLTYLHGDGDSHFTLYIDCILFPAIVLLCGYFISPRYKFKTTLALTIFYVLTIIYESLTNEYVLRASNPFILLYLVIASMGLYGIYQIENKK